MGSMNLVSAWPLDKRARVAAAIVIIVGVAYLCLPRLTGWSLEHVHKEDGLIFLGDFLKDGWGALFQTYTGYLHVGPRIITGVCGGALPADMFAGCVGISMAVFRGMLAVVTFAVFMPYAKSWKWALAAAAAILFIGVGQQEVLGNITNMRWFTDVAAVLVLLGNFRKPAPAAAVSVLAIVAACSDPLALILLPIALWRLIALRGWGRVVPGAYIGAGAVHYLLMDSSARTADWGFIMRSPVEFFAQAFVRGPLEALVGQNGAQVAINIVGPYIVLLGLLLPLAMVGVAWNRTPRPVLSIAVTMVLVGMAILCATLLFAPLEVIALSKEGSVGAASRYALLPATLIAQALLLAAPWAVTAGTFGRLAGWGVVGLMVAAAVADSPGDSWNAHGPKWAQTVEDARSDCTEEPSEKLTVPVTPQGVPMSWTATVTCHWVGAK